MARDQRRDRNEITTRRSRKSAPGREVRSIGHAIIEAEEARLGITDEEIQRRLQRRR